MAQDTYLSHKQSLFVEQYIQHGGNGTAAARAAGCRGTTATLGAVAHENLNKPHIRDEIARQRAEIRAWLEISTQAKRELLWETANECAKCEEVIRSVKVETMPDRKVLKTNHTVFSLFDSTVAIKAIRELNKMDGDYASTRHYGLARAASGSASI